MISLSDINHALASTTEYLDSYSILLGSFKLSLLLVIKGLFYFILIFWLARVASHLMERWVGRAHRLSGNSRTLAIKFLNVLIYFSAIAIGLNLVGVDLTALAVFGGAVGVGIGLGLQKITGNFISGIILLFENSLKVGDMIDVGGQIGWVRQLAIRYVLIETADNREIMIPNEDLIVNRVTNYTFSNPSARVEITVGVAYGTDLKRAMSLALEAVKAHPRCIPVPEPLVFMTRFTDSSIEMVIYFWIANIADGTFGPRSDVIVALHETFAQNGIVIPFPQREVRMLQEKAEA